MRAQKARPSDQELVKLLIFTFFGTVELTIYNQSCRTHLVLPGPALAPDEDGLHLGGHADLALGSLWAVDTKL